MISLKTASEKDFPLIADLASEIWHEHYTPIIGREQVDYMLGKFYAAKSLNEQVQNGQAFYLLVDENGPNGFISVSAKNNDTDMFLHKFYILPRKQNKGGGAAVFKKVFEELYSPQTIRLTVNRQNYKSINFYFKLGFKIEKTEDFDIGNNYFMNDFVMLWKRGHN